MYLNTDGKLGVFCTLTCHWWKSRVDLFLVQRGDLDINAQNIFIGILCETYFSALLEKWTLASELTIATLKKCWILCNEATNHDGIIAFTLLVSVASRTILGLSFGCSALTYPWREPIYMGKYVFMNKQFCNKNILCNIGVALPRFLWSLGIVCVMKGWSWCSTWNYSWKVQISPSVTFMTAPQTIILTSLHGLGIGSVAIVGSSLPRAVSFCWSSGLGTKPTWVVPSCIGGTRLFGCWQHQQNFLII